MLTKGDTLTLPALELLEEQGLTIAEALPRATDVATQILSQQQKELERKLNTKKYPPKAYLPMASEYSETWYDFSFSNMDILMKVWTKRVLIVSHF